MGRQKACPLYAWPMFQLASAFCRSLSTGLSCSGGDTMAEFFTLLIPDLPDDISLHIFARVPRSSHPILALVSRSWRSVLRSPLLSAVRSSLNLSSPLLLINARTPSSPSLWFSLDPLPNPTPNPLPSPPFPVAGAAAATIGSSLFLIGGSLNGVPSSAVQILDSATRQWSLGPRMSTAREFSAAAAIHGRVYAAGGCPPSVESWAEVLNPGGVWEAVRSPLNVRERWMHGCAVLGGRILAVADRGGVVYDPASGEWGSVPKRLDLGWRGRAAVVGGLLYSYDYLGKIKAYDPEVDQWLQVEGVDKELPRFLCGATLANYGGLLCLVWEGEARRKEMDIMCAGMRISRTDGGGLRGDIVWKEKVVLAGPKGSSIVHCLAVEL